MVEKGTFFVGKKDLDSIFKSDPNNMQKPRIKWKNT